MSNTKHTAERKIKQMVHYSHCPSDWHNHGEPLKFAAQTVYLPFAHDNKTKKVLNLKREISQFITYIYRDYHKEPL